MSLLAAKDIINFVIYLVLFGSTIFINKYVLSVLNFIYPTIFQGWQTLIGGVLLRILLSRKCLPVSFTSLDKAGFISLLPSFLFFAAGIVASSKALAGLNIAIFLCLHNTLNAALYLLNFSPSTKDVKQIIPAIFSILNILAAFGAVLFDIDMTFSDSPYFWMLVYLACLAVQNLHSKIIDARYNEVDRLYFSYIFSVIVLAPASLYLEEAFDVLRFPNASRYDFYAGCILSGVAGLFLNLVLIKIRVQPYFNSVDAVGHLLMVCLSFVVFKDAGSTLVNIFIFINLATVVFIPIPISKNVEIEREGIEETPIMKEEIVVT